MATGILTSDPGIFRTIVNEFDFVVDESSNRTTVYKSNKSNKLLIVVKVFDSGQVEHISEMLLRHSVDFLISVEHATSCSRRVPVGAVLLCDEMSSLEGPVALWHPNKRLVMKKFNNQPISHLFENLAYDDWVFPHSSLLTTTQIVSEPPMKEWLNDVIHADLNEFCGLLVHSLCTKMNIDYAVVRGIVTGAGVKHSDFYIKLQCNERSVAMSIVFNPFRLITLIKFFNRRSKMRKNASKILRRLLFVEAV